MRPQHDVREPPLEISIVLKCVVEHTVIVRRKVRRLASPKHATKLVYLGPLKRPMFSHEDCPSQQYGIVKDSKTKQ